jgi:peptidylprolyl isomerase
MIQIPPKLGYGKEGQGEDIPGDSTLYFVVDILDAADTKPKPEPAPEATPEASPGTPEPTPESTPEPSTDASTEE